MRKASPRDPARHGVTLSASGRSLAVVFDCDSEIPKWIELPLPAGK